MRLFNMAPFAGLEPATYGLTVRRSTDWTKRELYGASRRNRTTDTRIFNPLLYRLSYRGKRMVPTTGIELVTYWLQVSCSTYWAKSAHFILLLTVCAKHQQSRNCGARRRNRTTDTRIFNPLLYRLSYPGDGALLNGFSVLPSTCF